MRPYLGPPWTDSHPIWAVDVFHHAPPIHDIQNTEIQEKKKIFCDVIASVLSMSHVVPMENIALKNEKHKC